MNAPTNPIASAIPPMTCRECDGEGDVESMALHEDRYHWRTCHKCGGSGTEPAYCPTCENTLTVDGYCVECDDWASLVFVERISPTRIAL